MRHNAIIVLEALLQGERDIDGYTCGDSVRIGDYEWVLAKGEHGPVPCIVATRHQGDKREQTLLGQPELGLGGFLAMCEKLSEEEVVAIGANTVLNQVLRGRSSRV